MGGGILVLENDMELSIEETLQQGVLAHKEGKLQDALPFTYVAVLFKLND